MRSSAKVGFWLAVGAIGAVGCGGGPLVEEERVGSTEWEIVNGQLDPGDPATVYVDLGGGSCSGTLITPLVVLTAKHCTEGVSTGSISVFFGSDASGPGTWIKAAHHEDNPQGQPGGPGDLALITLKSAGPTTPIPVNEVNASTLIGHDVHIVGFGVTSEYGSDSGVKRHGYTKLMSVEPGLIFTNVKPSSTCYGDSGGPTFINLNGKDYVMAATSYGTSVCGAGEDASARTDDSLPWIKKYIAAHDPTAGPGASCEKDGQCAAGCSQPDPDCPCAADGYCTNACGDVAKDPDCKGCGTGDGCRQDCPSLDTDCCATDGNCNQACGAMDADCGGGAGVTTSVSTGSDGSAGVGVGGGSPTGGAGGGNFDDPTKPRSGQGPLIWTGCSVARDAGSSSDLGGLASLGAVAGLALVRTASRRRRG